MMTRAMILCLALGACASSPEPAYYTLTALPGARLPAALGSIEVRRPSLAGYLDRAEILTQVVGQRLQVAHGERWAEPLAIMIGRVLTDDLAARLPNSTVFSEASDLSLRAARVVELSIAKLDLDLDGYLRLRALLVIRSDAAQTPVQARTIALSARPTTRELPRLVAAMSGLLGQLADEIAGSLRTE